MRGTNRGNVALRTVVAAFTIWYLQYFSGSLLLELCNRRLRMLPVGGSEYYRLEFCCCTFGVSKAHEVVKT